MENKYWKRNIINYYHTLVLSSDGIELVYSGKLFCVSYWLIRLIHGDKGLEDMALEARSRAEEYFKERLREWKNPKN